MWLDKTNCKRNDNNEETQDQIQDAEAALYQKVREPYMKYKIEKNTVQETLILPLYSRKLCSELYPNLYRDETAVRLIDQIDYDFSEAEKNSRSLMQRFGALEVAMRQNDLAWEVLAYLKTHPCAAVVNLGCGLDNTGRACDNGRCKIYNLDFPDVIALRQQLLPAGGREQNIPCDLKDPSVSDFFRFLAKVGDGRMKMQIVKIGFGGKV